MVVTAPLSNVVASATEVIANGLVIWMASVEFFGALVWPRSLWGQGTDRKNGWAP
jgi:hypothetical protein